MKLLIVTVIKECRKEVANIFDKMGIGAYSVTDIHGVSNDEETEITSNWFGGEWEEDYESIMLFSFTNNDIAENTLAAIDSFNKNKNSPFPLKAIVIPIEKAVGFFKKNIFISKTKNYV